MKKRSMIAQRVQAFLLTVCLILSLCSVTVFAEPVENDGAMTVGEEINTSECEEKESVNQEESVILEDNNDTDLSEDAEEVISEDTSVLEEEIDTEETDTEASEEETEEPLDAEESDFEETGVFGLSIIDNNGTEVKEWYDSSSKIYYMFLTNAVSIPDAVLQVKGLKMKSVSKGTLDPATNYVTGAFAKNGDSITLTDESGKKYNVVVKQSGIPSLSITLNGVSLATVKRGTKEVKYPGNTVLLTDASGNVHISQKNNVEVKGRGNSTWSYSDKKPYQIKFEKKQSVLGMAKAKKWVLLANYFDDSMLRNKTAYYLGDQLGMAYSPDLQYCDLWIDGEYQGAYTIGEKAEITDTRLNLTDPLGAMFEHDEVFYMNEEVWFQDSVMKRHFVLADQVDETRTSEAVSSFQKKINTFMTYLTTESKSSITLDKLARYIDVDSFAKWYLVSEYMCNSEAFVSSWYWYTDGANDVIHLGPLWDFDSSQGSVGRHDSATEMYGATKHVLFMNLLKVPAFSNRLKEIYKQYRAEFSSLPAKVKQWGSEISVAADVNYTRWKTLGKPSRKGKDFESTYEKAVTYHANWLSARDKGFGIDVAPAATATTSCTVSASGKTMTVTAKDITGTTSPRVAIWSASDGQDDLTWYNLEKNSDGSMSVRVDLTKHGGSDKYYAHVYGGGTMLGAHSVTVTMTDAAVAIKAEYRENSNTIHVEVSGVEDYDSLKTAVWTSKDGQDDLVWYSKTVKADGTAVYDIDRASHKDSGSCSIHVYGVLNGSKSFLKGTSITLPEEKPASVTAVQESGATVLNITAKNVSEYTDLKVAVWGAADAQNDLKWYTMTKHSDGRWTCTADLMNHKEEGTYYVHLYGKKDGKSQFITSVKPEVTLKITPVASAKVITAGETVRVSLENAASLESVKFAVWGTKDGQNDLVWYTGKKNSGGVWTADVSLAKHKETGAYSVHVYGVMSGKQTFQASTTFTVDKIAGPVLTAAVSESGKVLVANLENGASFAGVKIAIWSSKDGQDDLKWYTAQKNLDGSWTLNVDLTTHGDTGSYSAHAYSVTGTKKTYVCATSFTVSEFKKPEITATDKGKTFVAKAAYAEDYTRVQFAVWSDKNGQDDIKWYTASKASDGSYRYTVDPAKHDGNGNYNIHAYGVKDGKKVFMGYCKFTENSF